MNNDSIDKSIKQHYEQKTLSPDAMAHMVSMTESLEQGKESFWRRRWQFQRNLSLAASFVIALLLVPLLWGPSDTLLVRVSQEVALNHNKKLASEYVMGSYQKLASVMEKLDFDLVSPERLKLAGYQVMGARYCSIQGNIAALVKLEAEDGGVYTLYETRSNSELAALHDKHNTENNVDIQTWQEGDIFFSLARSDS